MITKKTLVFHFRLAGILFLVSTVTALLIALALTIWKYV